MNTCVVVGASVASSLSAYVLSPFFKKVILIDEAKSLGEYRPTLQQGSQFHLFLAKGQEVLKDLIPEIEVDFRELGCPKVSIPRDMQWSTDQGNVASGGVSFKSLYLMDRMALEKILISKLKALPNVEFLLDSKVTDIILTQGQAKGVRYKKAGEEQELQGDFLVLGGGRRFPLEEFLRKNHLNVPQENFVPAEFMYLSQIRALNEGEEVPWKVWYEQAVPPDAFAGAVIGKVEEPSNYMFMIGGLKGHFPKLGHEMEFIEGLKNPVFKWFYENSSPVTKAQPYRIDGSRHRPYGKMGKQWPENMVALGDCVCAFNPVYGQGLSVAALEAQALKEFFLKMKSPTKRTGSFQKRVDQIIKLPWILGTTEDRKLYGGKISGFEKLLSHYMKRLLKGATVDHNLTVAFFKVIHMLKGPQSLFAPKTFLRVLKAGKGRGPSSQ